MKIIGNIVKVLGKIWTGIVVVGAIILLALRFAAIPFGYEPIWCMSNSMAPAFHEGALCYIDKNYDVESMEVGDIIAYELSNGSMVTHRVFDITEEGIITKGDANKNVDFAPISKAQVIGENVIQIEHLGNLFKDFPNKLLISIIVFAISVMLALDVLSSVLLGEEDGKKDEDNQKTIQVDSADNEHSDLSSESTN